MTASGMILQDLAPFGVEVGLDLSRPPREDDRRALVDLLYERGLLVFRGQSLSDEDHTRVMEIFGKVLVEEGGHREISADGNLGNGPLLFHSDLAFTEHPFKLLSLYALDVSPGTATLFANGARVLQTMPGDLRTRLTGLEATNVIPPSQGERLVEGEIPATAPRQTRPAVIAHPHTRRPVLFVSEQQTSRIEGLPPEESTALLGQLFEHFYAADNVYAHEWREGDLVIWDNIALQHARRDQSRTPRRRLRRIAVAEKTFFELCPQFPPDDPRIAAWGVGGRLTLA